jgi:putative protease
MKTELLAPAKDKETAIAAIDCGADAVYIGASAFGARKNAGNSLEDIKEIVAYAHKFWAKVFVTLNTILTDEELSLGIKLAYELQNIGVDAILVQDMGLLNEIIKTFSSKNEKFSVPIHMSTQCDNYLPQKVKFFNNIGVSRVVLARETSLERIKTIHNENPNLELEGFVHGALCVSMSGQCYLSEYIGGRSANRGECAQPCRKAYNIETTDGEILKSNTYALCLKDFNGSNLIEEMKSAGIYSFKIEGRLKDIGYVKNIVSYYRQKLGKGISSGKSTYQFNPAPEKSFNRGFTEYFLKDRTDCFNFISPKSRGEYLGEVLELNKVGFILKSEKEIHSGDGIYFEGDGFGINKVEFVKKGIFRIYPNKQVHLKVGSKLYRNFDIEFEKELTKPVKRQIGVKIELKSNNENGLNIKLIDEDKVSISKNLPLYEQSKNPQKMKETFIKQFNKTGEEDFYITEINLVQGLEIPFMPVSEVNKLRRELFIELMKKRVEFYNTNIKEVQKEMNYTNYFTNEVDYRANVHNQSAQDFYEKCGVKVLEPSFEKKKPNRQVELMRCKHCIKYALNMCKSPKKLILRDSYGNVYPLKFDCKNCEMKVLSPK